ncbi:ATP-binding cassette domain-containing protein [Kineococcus aurantiacus]|uniref:ABC-type sugar transport system ATPase subunit/ribose/xylose/arabinose/galactoside ABC-type transport system permease subunit n=1 Tax=Kineococcus aurantiacus TaxID=37633 RepID=A0A7Y9J3A3_9ACTN|nr:ATP-binding cassette domain-containing protein [Kineococcus aurantiacus]NYD25116.1 ABC-type sugar transport system ATPase subunit/ribose/xylose/arabinose/galactoside ABC-type transport system permease subunit [Kineococcus aurantiacus]
MSANRTTEPSETTVSRQDGPALRVTGLRKEYGPVVALADARLALTGGEIHALVGENGSGKSTLVNLVSGTVAPTAGSVEIAGQVLLRNTPAAAARLGVMTVFQDGSMLPELTVGQNLYIGTRADQRPRYHQVDAWAQELLETSGITGVSSRTATREIPPGDRQLIEIARAVHARPPLLILDEATSALDASGVDRVMDMIVRSAAAGSAVLFVTHRLGEVFRVAHNISVLRDGEWQSTVPASSLSTGDLVDLMAGTSVGLDFPVRPGVPADAPVVLTGRGLSQGNLKDVSLDVRAGEVLGLAGADGNGQGLLLRALGANAGAGGVLTVGDTELRSPVAAKAKGVVYLSGDRKRESLFPTLSVLENLTAGVLGRLRENGLVHPRREREHAREQIQAFGIRVGSPAQPVSFLSGGNQQKVAISRALSDAPRVLLVDEPTQGVDVRSRMDIYRTLRAAADAGSAVVVVSSDAAELAGICDRIAVMSRGRIITELDGPTATEDSIVSAFAVESEVVDPASSAAVSAATSGGSVRRVLRAHEDLFRLGVLAVVLVALFSYAQGVNPSFSSAASIYNIGLLALPLTVAAVAQFWVLLVGGIDIAVGATMGLSLVALSFTATSGGGAMLAVVAVVTVVVCGLLVGALNALLVEGAKIVAVVATIATMGIAGGLALVLRPTAAGLLSPDLLTWLTHQTGALPTLTLVLVPLLLVGDWCIWRSGPGVRLRAAGLQPNYALRLGIPVRRLRVASYLACGVTAGLAGLVLAGSVGTGEATAGNDFTLLSMAAPVLGGASLLGGRGCLFGCLLGGLLLALSNTIVPMLGISDAWSFMIVGILTVVALLAYSRGGENTSGVRSLVIRVLRRPGPAGVPSGA